MEDGVWIACEGTEEGHVPDSRVHRYDREIGFSISAEELEMCNRNAAIAQAERAARHRSKQKSHAQTVSKWALFERCCLEYHPDEPYTAYLVELKRAAEDLVGERLHFQAPPALLVLAYTKFLRMADPSSARPDHKGSTIRKYAQTAVSSLLLEFSFVGSNPAMDKRVQDLLDEYDDGEESAEAFDVEATMPKLWTALWALRGWGIVKRLCAWSMLLIAMSIMARASCITTFCPLIEDTRLPKARHWDKDGLPKYIIICMTDWKSRKKSNKGKKYYLKIHRNYLDETYCPVTWTLIYLSYAGLESGPLFQRLVKGKGCLPVTDTIWCGMTNHWFAKAGIRVQGGGGSEGNPRMPASGATNHSIRRSAAQWAGRCGAREMDVRNAGRWRSMAILAKYMAQGAVQREEYEDDEEGPREDPIFSMFVFKKVTSASDGGLDIM